MRRWCIQALGVVAVVLASSPSVLALGSSAGRNVVDPALDFSATLTDRDGSAVECTRVNAGGEVELEGEMGRGRLRIPFDHIREIELAGDSGDDSRATVRLDEGEPITMKLRGSLSIYGRTRAGLYEIRVRDLKSIRFHR